MERMQNHFNVDYFNLHQRKKHEITLEMLDYDYIEKCENIDILKGILDVLRSGKEGKYEMMEKATEKRLFKVLPEKERLRILSAMRMPTQNEIEEITQDINQWTVQIQEKDEDLKELKEKNNKNSNIFKVPVRGEKILQEKEKMQTMREKKTQLNNKNSERISAYNYREWEKYDVEKELKKDDKDEQSSYQKLNEKIEQDKLQRQKEIKSLPPSVEVDQMSPIELEYAALNEKEKGNEVLKSGDPEEAALYYTRSLAYDNLKNAAVVYANRALCYYKLKLFQMGEDDCTRAIELQPTYLKAWLRRGIIRHCRGKYKDAIDDFDKACELEPKSAKSFLSLKKKSEEKYKEVEGKDLEEKKFKRFEIIED